MGYNLLESQWSLLKEIKVSNHNHIEALADVPADSPWFSGHFPGEPILPGIALVYMAEQAIVQDALKKGEQVSVACTQKSEIYPAGAARRNSIGKHIRRRSR